MSEQASATKFAWWMPISVIGGLVSSFWAGTQWAAMRFAYQPALGSGIISFGGVRIYEPFSILGWVFRWRASEGAIDEYLTQSLYVVFVGVTLTLIVTAAWNVFRTRAKDAPENLHGSAHWATDEEIRASGMLINDGVCCGSVELAAEGFLGKLGRKAQRILRDNEKTHIAVVAPTRSGKGVGIVLPTLLTWRHSVAVHDIKGENYALTAGFRHKAGHLVLRLDPTCQDGTGSRWNALQEIRIFTRSDVRDASNIAQQVADPEGKGMDDHWISTSFTLLQGVFLHVSYQKGSGSGCMAAASQYLVDPEFEDVKQMLSFMQNFKHDPEGKMAWKDSAGRPTKTHPAVALVASEMLKKEEKELGSVVSTAKTKLGTFTEPIMAENTSESDFRARELMNLDQPVALYYIVPPNDKERLRPLTRLFFSLVIRRLTEDMKFEGGKSVERFRHRLLLLIDELPSLRKLDVLQDGLAYIAGYGLKAMLIFQDMIQLKDAYGDKESIWSGCHRKVVYAPNTFEAAKPLSDMLGKRTVEYKSYNHSGTRTAHGLGQVSISTTLAGRELLTPDELLGLPETDMLVLQAGRPPILGKKLRYYEMPALQARAEIAPPARCSIAAMEGGEERHWWAMILVEPDDGSLRMWLNLMRRNLPPVTCIIRQEQVIDGQLVPKEFAFDLFDDADVPKGRGPFAVANELVLKARGATPDYTDEYFVSLRLLDESRLTDIKYCGWFEVVSERKKEAIKLARKALVATHGNDTGYDYKIMDAERGRSHVGEIIVVHEGYAIQDVGYENALVHKVERVRGDLIIGQRVEIDVSENGMGRVI